MRPKRLLTAVLAALLLICGIPAAAFAETDVVLENESQDTSVTTGDSSFSNSTATESKAATFDPPGDGETVTSTQTTGTPAQISSIAPSISAPSAPSAPVVKAAKASAAKSVDSLFVGLSFGGGSISP